MCFLVGNFFPLFFFCPKVISLIAVDVDQPVDFRQRQPVVA